MEKCLAIIPARGGSKRIIKKNIKLFCGKPMISYPIKNIQRTKLFDKLIVSSDDVQIEKLIKTYQKVEFFKRENHLSDDQTPTVPVIKNVLENLSNVNEYKYCCCVYPCSPLLKPEHLIDAFNILKKNDFEFVYPVVEFSHPIQRALSRKSNGKMSFIKPKNDIIPTQNFEKRYHDTGQFYFGKTDAWLNEKKMHLGYGMVFKKNDFVDIDNLDDWVLAENLYKIRKDKL